MLNAPSEAYPFATQDGKAIPLDILRPSNFMYLDTIITSAAFTLPAGSKVATFLASENCLLRFDAAVPAIVSGTPITDCLFLPKNVIVISSVLSEKIHARTIAASSASIFIQCIEKWAGLAMDSQYRRK